MEKSSAKLIRVFLALDFSGQLEGHLSKLIDQLQVFLKGWRWVPPDQIHLTLFFMGEISEDKISESSLLFEKIASETEPFNLIIKGWGVFPETGTPRILWAGIDGDLGPLKKLQRAVEIELSRIGFLRQERPFLPHLTLARAKPGEATVLPANLIDRKISFTSDACAVNSMTLFQSLPAREGSRFIKLAAYPFN